MTFNVFMGLRKNRALTSKDLNFIPEARSVRDLVALAVSHGIHRTYGLIALAFPYQRPVCLPT